MLGNTIDDKAVVFYRPESRLVESAFMDKNLPVPQYWNSDALSFAYPSVRERWPTILTQVIDDVTRTMHELPIEQDGRVSEGKQILNSLAALKYDMQHNRTMTRLEADGLDDIDLYNEELSIRASYATSSSKSLAPTWHDVEWLYSECYLYRRIYTLFSTSQHWKQYDYFNRQKLDTFRSSRPAVTELCSKYREIVGDIQHGKGLLEDTADPAKIAEAEELVFKDMAEICLWGNATDLSLLTTHTWEDLQKLQGSNARKESEKNILVNDLSPAFSLLNKAKQAQKATRRVDIVLDNAGFELFVDLVLAGYLLATGLATEIVLHPKSMPWFVSDVMPKDFAQLLSAIQDPGKLYDQSSSHQPNQALSDQDVTDIKFVFDDWSRLHSEGRIVIRPNIFWTHGVSFWQMPKVAPSLLTDLQESELVIFKGDLNYRKLTGDGAWDAATPFIEAIGPLGKGSGLRVMALRTCKADVVVGLPPGKDEELRQRQGGDVDARKWAWKGKWAVIELSDDK